MFITGRIIGEERGQYRISLGEEKSRWAKLKGSYLGPHPCVGDWVTCRVSADGTLLVVEELMERTSFLRRQDPGGREQGIAANITHMAVATSANQDLSVRRLERYVTLGWDSGATPVVLVTKMDLVLDPELLLSELKHELPGVEIIGLSVIPSFQPGALVKILQPGNTMALVGSSGVGKSTLVNHLIGADVQIVNEARVDDDKGRHTTTSRGMFVSQWGGMVIDTPGMRELALVDAEEGLDQGFQDVLKFAANCRFRDCSHHVEPSCGIQNAIATGALAQERWQSYLKLLGEIRHFQRKIDKGAAAEERKRWRAIQKDVRLRQKIKGK